MKRWTLLEIWARTPRIALATFLIFSANIFIAKPCWADDASTKAARELTQKIVLQLDRDKRISVEVVDLTGQMHGADADTTKGLIESELRTHGYQLATDGSGEVKIRFTLSRDLVERIWIADFTREGKSIASMIPFGVVAPDLSPWATRVHLDRELVYSQNSPMLDFACDNSGAAKECGEILVLNTDTVVLMAPERKFPSAPIPHNKPWPRDLRGRIRRDGPAFDVNVGGISCFGKTNVDGLMSCLPAANRELFFEGPMSERVLALVASEQNWFDWISVDPASRGAKKRPPFYSVGGIELNGQTVWAASGIDGQTRLFTEKSADSVASVSHWGSDLATVKSECGTGWQILATKPRDYSETDAIAVYEWTGTEFKALSDEVEMDGPIVSMWSEKNGGSARAIVHNLKTGNYEAYLLKVGCSQ